MSAVRHTVAIHAATRSRLRGAPSSSALVEQLLDDASDEQYVRGAVVGALKSGAVSLSALLTCLSARLHRALSLGGTQRVAALLLDIISLSDDAGIRDMAYQLIVTFPDLLVPFTGLASEAIVREALYAWLPLGGLSSPHMSPLLYHSIVGDLILFRSGGCAGSSDDVSALTVLFLQSICRVDRESVFETHHLVSSFLLKFARLNYRGSQAVALALMQLVLAFKGSSMPKLDCTPLIRAITECVRCSPPPPIVGALCSLPVFSGKETREAISILAAGHKDGATFDMCRIVSLLALADNPYGSESFDRTVEPYFQLARPDGPAGDTSMAASSIERAALEGLESPLILMMALLYKDFGRHDMPLMQDGAADPGTFEYAYMRFLSAFVGAVGPQGYRPGALPLLARIATAHTSLCQRAFLAVNMVMSCTNVGADRLPFVEGLGALVVLGKVDDVCNRQSMETIRQLASGSPLFRAIVVPNLVSMANEASWLFPLISDALPVLAASRAVGGDQDAVAFAMSVYRLSLCDLRQAHLNLSLALSQKALLSGDFLQRCPKYVMALFIESIHNLIKLHHISPAVAWTRLAAPFIARLGLEEILDRREAVHVVRALCNVASHMHCLIPPPEEPVAAVEGEGPFEESVAVFDPAVVDALAFLRSASKKHPFAAMRALSKFPPLALSSACDYNIMAAFPGALASATAKDATRGECWEEAAVASFIAEWTAGDIQQMPRSLFLGSSERTPQAGRGAPSSQQRGASSKAPTGQSGSDAEEILRKARSAWTGNCGLASVFLSTQVVEADASSKSLLVTLERVIALPPLGMQPGIVQAKLFAAMQKYLRAHLASIQDVQDYEKTTGNILNFIEEKIAQAQAVSPLSYALLLWALLTEAISFFDGDHGRCSRAFETLMSILHDNCKDKSSDEPTQAFLPARFAKSDPVLAVAIFSVRLLDKALGSDRHEGERSERIARMISQQETAGLTALRFWLHIDVLRYGKDHPLVWPSFAGAVTLADLQDAHRFLLGRAPPLSQCDGAEGARLPSFVNVAATVQGSLKKAEQMHIAGLAAFSLGAYAAGIVASGNEEAAAVRRTIDEAVGRLKDRGPVAAKVDDALFILGLTEQSRMLASNVQSVGGAGDIPARDLICKEIEGDIYEALGKTTDAKLAMWLTMILSECYAAQSARKESSVEVSPPRSEGANRFGPESPFGACISLLEGAPRSQGVADEEAVVRIGCLLAGLASLKLLPRMNWALLVAPFAEVPSLQSSLNAFLLGAFQVRVSPSQRHADEGIVSMLIDRIISGALDPFEGSGGGASFLRDALDVVSGPLLERLLSGMLANLAERISPENMACLLEAMRDAPEEKRGQQVYGDILRCIESAKEYTYNYNVCAAFFACKWSTLEARPSNEERRGVCAFEGWFSSKGGDGGPASTVQDALGVLCSDPDATDMAVRFIARQEGSLLQVATAIHRYLVGGDEEMVHLGRLCDAFLATLAVCSPLPPIVAACSLTHPEVTLRIAWLAYRKRHPGDASRIASRLFGLRAALPEGHDIFFCLF